MVHRQEHLFSITVKHRTYSCSLAQSRSRGLTV